jgi:hypothetical protein
MSLFFLILHLIREALHVKHEDVSSMLTGQDEINTYSFSHHLGSQVRRTGLPSLEGWSCEAPRL